MTKRWERALRALDDVEVPADRIRERARREPSGDGPGPMRSPRQRVVAGVVAFAVFIAAGAFAWRMLQPTSSQVGGTNPGPLVLRAAPAEGDPEPGVEPQAVASLHLGDVEVPMLSAFTVSGGGDVGLGTPGQEWDVAPEDYVAVPADTAVRVADAGADPLTVELWDASQRLVTAIDPLGDAPFARVDPGRYRLYVDAHWSSADGGWIEGEFQFGVEIVAPMDPKPPAGTIVARFYVEETTHGGSGPSATLTTPDGTIDGTPTSFSWETGSSIGYVDTVTPEFTDEDFVPVPVGSLLAVETDGSEVELTLHEQGTYPFKKVEPYGPVTDPVPLNQTPGKYILHLTPVWEEGTVNYYFPIELVGAEPPPASANALLSFTGNDPPEATLTWKGTQQAALGEYTWCDGSGGCVDGVTDRGGDGPSEVGYLPIPAGTPFSLEGDATELKGVIRTLDGENVSDIEFKVPGSVPEVPGRYLAELHVGFHGSTEGHGSATFFFGVEATSLPTPSVSPVPVTELPGSSWHLVAIDGIAVPAGADPVTLAFTADRLGGNDGCNSYGGPYSVDGSSIDVGQIASTAMLCSGGETMERAHALYEGLKKATSFERTDERLTLTSPGGSLTFEAT